MISAILIVIDKYDILLVNIGKKIKEKRLAKKLTQTELASIIDCEVKSIQRIEKGKMNMSLKMFILILNELELTPNILLNNNYEEKE